MSIKRVIEMSISYNSCLAVSAFQSLNDPSICFKYTFSKFAQIFHHVIVITIYLSIAGLFEINTMVSKFLNN